MKTTDVLGCLGWACFFLLTSAFIPLLGPFFCLLTPLPFLIYSTKLGLQNGVKLALLSLVVTGLIAQLTEHPEIIFWCIELSAMGLVLAALFKKRFGIGQTILFASTLMALLNLGYLFLLSLSSGQGPFEMILGHMHEYLKATVAFYEEAGMPKEQVHEIETYGTAFINSVSFSFMAVTLGFSVWLNIIIAKPFFRMRNLQYPDFIPMAKWKAPDSMIWGVIASGFAFFIMSGFIKSLSANVLIVLMFIYFFHGVSIVLFFLNKYQLPPWIRICIYFLIVIQQPLPILLAFAGIFDQWINFRKLDGESEKS